MRIGDKVRAAWAWFAERMKERSTLAGVATAIGAAAALPYPWSMASFFVGCAVAFIPDGKVVQ